MSFTATDPQNHQSQNTWFTPKEFIEKLGEFDLDPCTVSYRPFNTANCHFEFDEYVNGLTRDWFGDVWLNPPYGKEMTPFVDKFIEHKKGIMLIFARMGNKDIHKLIESGAYFYFLRKRVKFISKDGKSDTNSGTDSCLVFYDDKYINKVKQFKGALR